MRISFARSILLMVTIGLTLGLAAEATARQGWVARLGDFHKEFEEFQREEAGGQLYYGDSEALLRVAHAAVYQSIMAKRVSEQLTPDQARQFRNQLEFLGERTRAQGGGLSVEQQQEVARELQQLAAAVDKQTEDNGFETSRATPELNRFQALIEDVMTFGRSRNYLNDRDVERVRRELDSYERDRDRARRRDPIGVVDQLRFAGRLNEIGDQLASRFTRPPGSESETAPAGAEPRPLLPEGEVRSLLPQADPQPLLPSAP